jgi:hypothetical protein
MAIFCTDNKGFKVKVKPFFWQFLPWLSSYTAQAIYPV